MKNEEKLNDIYNKYRENKNSHVYLVETNNVDNAVFDIKNLLIKICSSIDDNNIEILIQNESLPTLTIIRPETQEIKIDAIEELIFNLQKIPVITKENYFIICDAEKLNQKSGNSMLKIIEDPDSDILGFFVCNSANNVMQTIQSRTQYIKLIYNDKNDFDENIENDSEKLYHEIFNNPSILNNKYYADNYKDINKMCNLLDCLVLKIQNFVSKQDNFDIIKKNEIIIKMIVEMESKIRRNGNINLLLDKFIIEVGRL